MPRAEYRDDKASKYWLIEIDGSEITTQWGRIGSTGEINTNEYADTIEAQQHYEKQIDAKINEGYELLVGDGVEAESRTEASSVNPQLEKIIIADPEKLESWLVYGDWLQAQQDPKGELLALEAALLANPNDKDLQVKVKAAYQKHETQLIVGLEKYQKQFKVVEWYMGFMKSVRVGTGDEDEMGLDKLVPIILDHPSAKFIQKLHLGPDATEDIMSFESIFDLLAERKTPQTLIELHVGERDLDDVRESDDDDYNTLWDISSTEVGFKKSFCDAFPRLQKLTVEGGYPQLESLAFPEMREFKVYTGGLPQSTIKVIANATWPKIEKLEILFGMENYGFSGSVADLAPIFAAKGLPKLTHLGLMNAEITDAICEAVVKSKILPQLKTLDLSMGCMTEKGAQILSENKKMLQHLETLNVDDNAMEASCEALLKGLCKNVIFGSQEIDKADEDWVYTSVGE